MKIALRLGLCLMISMNLTPATLYAEAASASAAAAQTAAVVERPAELAAIAGNNRVSLSWKSVVGADTYQIKRSTVNGGPYALIQSIPSSTEYTDLTAENGQTYYYVVTASRAAAESMISDQVKAVPYAPLAGVPEAPRDFAATAHYGSVDLTWTAVPGAALYTVKRAEASEGPYVTAVDGLTSPSFTDNVVEGDSSSIQNGKTYYYTVAAVNEHGESRPAEELAVSPAKVITVAQDGSGDFTNLADAVAAVNAQQQDSRTVLYVKKGTYTQADSVQITAPYVSLVGEGSDNTRIVGNKSNADAPNQAIQKATLLVSGDHFTASNVSIENNAAPEKGQAVALAVLADQAVMDNVKLVGYQDTLYAGIRSESPRLGRQYYRNSTIMGRTDFIYGPSNAAVFDHVDAISINSGDSGGVITAPATKNETDAGLVFINSRLLKNGTTQGKHYLGRPWQDNPIIRFINTYMDDHIDPAGWTTMQVPPYLFAEYNSTGPGASPGTRVMGTQMTAEEASELTIPRIFDGWDPTRSLIVPEMFPELRAQVAPSLPDGLNGSYTKPVMIYLEQNEELPEADRVQYRINGGDWTAYAAEFEVASPGENRIEFRYVDKSGNASAVQSIAVTIDPSAEARVPAFPGAEGAAMYAKGGRGGDVYEVTTLEDYDTAIGEAPIPGSLRDAVSRGNRIVVFRTSGTIHLKRELDITSGNLTIAGQTAPGDGIAVSGYMVKFGNNDVGTDLIIRYIRFRDGINVLSDAADITGNNIIVDHCSFSWSSDETFTIKNRKNFTVQWSIISDSLNLSIHGKGAHGYGGIWGGTNATYHHNLLANHNSRNPRFDRQTDPDNYPTTIDYRNNVVYNWGGNSAYGGEQAIGINMINNYYKPGPSTFDGVKNRIVAPSGEANSGSWYIDGNYMEGAPDVSQDNWVTGSDGKWKAIKPDGPLVRKYKPFLIPNEMDPIGGPVATDTAQDAYAKVLESAGASLPKRDSLDAKVIQDVKDGTGRIINTIQSDGGLPELNSAPAPADSDHDGMPDDWELQQGLNPNDSSDGALTASNGYTNLENYINSLVVPVTPNPEVKTTGIQMHQAYTAGQPIVIQADARAESGIAKVVFYTGDQEIGQDNTAPYALEWKDAPLGEHYIYSKAIDNTGRMTLSSVTIIYVDGAGDIAPWAQQDIGQVAIPGSASLEEPTFTVKGSGAISGRSDSFHYVYQPVQGNFEMMAYVNFNSEIDDPAKAGLMVRDSLAPNAPGAAIMLTPDVSDHAESGRMGLFMSRTAEGQSYVSKSATSSILKAPFWLKLTRTDNTIAGYVSTDQINWGLVDSSTLTFPATVYVGMAVDAPKATSNSNYLTSATFTGVQLNRSAQFTLQNPAEETADIPEYTVAGTVIDGASVSIARNGETVVSSDHYDAGAQFSYDLALKEGVNTITVSVLGDEPGSVVSAKTIQVTYNKSAVVFKPETELPGQVSNQELTFTVNVNRDATASVRLNGSVIMQNVAAHAGTPLLISLMLQEGINEIVLSGTDEYGNSGSNTFRVKYNKDWGAGKFTIQRLTLTDLNGNLTYSLSGLRDIVAEVQISSNSGVEQGGTIVIAVLDSQNRMVRYALLQQTVPAGASVQAKAVVSLPEKTDTGYNLQAFVWDDPAARQIVSNVITVP
ncbi:pectinesterase family protein [Paenibacillus doosanensis]|uniref:pectinesterase family protein n=1 Tax=Paenibacillus doosanensis TaxID=1229154 RepID=UPI00217FB170|nr:pectinesterase family protein [Paenibacillus doosanensis]MCS7462147.1 pectinesterase family protein [Paenibacillus doosanensis]